MSAIDDVFARLKAEKKKAFIPFVTAGDPDLATTSEALKVLAREGASLCEVGIPYTDPIADGPVVQASYTRALSRGIKLADTFKMLKETTADLPIPVVTMVSYSIVYRHGLKEYVADAQAAGVAGAIVPDLLVEESDELDAICRERDFSLIRLVTPTTPRERALKIAQASTGFLYYVSVTGITGERTQLPPDLIDNVSWLRENSSVPVCIGFGISQPEHVKMLAPVADGLIVGSAIVRRMVGESGSILQDVASFADSLVSAYPA